jgi:hypothetical protein
VVDGRGQHPLFLEPVGGSGMQVSNLVREGFLESLTEKIPEEMVVSVPLADVIESLEEKVFLQNFLEKQVGVRAPGESCRKIGCDP